MAIPSIIYLLGAGYQNYMERNINHTHYAALPLPPPSPSLMVGMEEIEYSFEDVNLLFLLLLEREILTSTTIRGN